jgi:hypothetical protein
MLLSNLILTRREKVNRNPHGLALEDKAEMGVRQSGSEYQHFTAAAIFEAQTFRLSDHV